MYLVTYLARPPSTATLHATTREENNQSPGSAGTVLALSAVLWLVTLFRQRFLHSPGPMFPHCMREAWEYRSLFLNKGPIFPTFPQKGPMFLTLYETGGPWLFFFFFCKGWCYPPFSPKGPGEHITFLPASLYSFTAGHAVLLNPTTWGLDTGHWTGGWTQENTLFSARASYFPHYVLWPGNIGPFLNKRHRTWGT